jgi:ligand-binding sensor domain-containing protein
MISLRLLGGIASCCIGLLAARAAFAQAEYQWTVYSALNSAQSVAFDDAGALWIATTGGVVGYTATNDSYQIYHTRDQLFPANEGLLSLNSTAIAFDPGTGDMYVGSDNGLVSIRKKSGRWSYSAEIASMTERPSRTIKGFAFHNGNVYILTAFGIGVYNPNDSSFIESYLRLSQSIPQNTPINAVAFWNGSIWAGTDKGLVRAPESGTNLAATDAWIPVPVGGATAIYSIVSLGGAMLVGTDSGVYVVDNQSAMQRGDIPVKPVRLAVAGNHILAATPDEVYRYEGTSFTYVSGSPDKITGIAVSKDGMGGVGFLKKGFALLEGNQLAEKRPNAPGANLFPDMARTSDGAIWTASADRDQGSDGAGVSRLKDGVWMVFNPTNTPELKHTKVWNVGAGTDGEAFVGTYVAGLTVIKPVDSGFQAKHYDATNSPAVGVNGDPFLVIGKAITDLNGRTWFLDFDPGSRKGPALLVRLRPGEESDDGSGFEAFLPPLGFTRTFRWIAIDDNGTKWLGSDAPGGDRGMMYYNDRGTITDESDDRVDVLTTDDGMLSNTQTAVVIDKLGELWIGTPKGASVLVNPASVVFSESAPVFRTIRPLSDVYIWAIAIDALNRKWVGTDQGVYLISADGEQVLQKFTTDNSPLVNNQIRSILSVDATGDIYIGTTNGMNKVSTTAVEPSKDQDQLTVSPHPFVIPSSEPLRIKGLPANATIKIFGLGGTLVREFQSPGGAVALWDGLDNSGNLVPSGIYIIAAGASNGDNAVLGKVAVIRP